MTDLMQDTVFALANGLVEKTDELILNAINERFGMHFARTAQSLKVLCDCHRLHRVKAPTGVETYSLNGVPFFEMHPMETRMDGFKLVAERKYRSIK